MFRLAQNLALDDALPETVAGAFGQGSLPSGPSGVEDAAGCRRYDEADRKMASIAKQDRNPALCKRAESGTREVDGGNLCDQEIEIVGMEIGWRPLGHPHRKAMAVQGDARPGGADLNDAHWKASAQPGPGSRKRPRTETVTGRAQLFRSPSPEK